MTVKVLTKTIRHYTQPLEAAWQRIPHKGWLFPGLVVGVVLLLTIFRISGSSVGVYSQLDGSPDSNLLLNNPRGVRSDEWLVITQLTFAQAENDYQKINDNLADGQNMALLDVPYKDWSTFFKPQNWAFFVLPLEYAFAFKWWFLLATVLIGCYLFVLQLFPGRYLRASLIASFVALSPMIFWWWTSGMLLTVGYSFLMGVAALQFLQAPTVRSRLSYSLLLAYLLICFVLLLYPPFQIPALLVMLAFVIGWSLEHFTPAKELKKLWRLWPYALLIVLLPAMVGAAFYKTNQDVITTTAHTVYPGARVVPSGDADPLLSFSSFLSPNLQYDEKAAEGYMGNQSEASTFIFIAPFLVAPAAYLIIRQRRRGKPVLWALAFVTAAIVILLARMHLATPWLDPIYRLALLDKVPGVRLLIGLGIAGIVQLALIIKALETAALSRREQWGLAALGGLSALAAMTYVGVYTTQHFPVFIASTVKALVFASLIAGAVFLILKRYFVAGLVLLVLFSASAVYRVHPFYRGLGPITTAPVIEAIESYPDDGSWVVVDDRLLVNFPLLAGKDSLTGIHFAPQMEVWDDLDPARKYEFAYNRYAHILFSTSKLDDPLQLKYADMFEVRFEPCGKFLQTRAEYVLSAHKLGSQCLQQSKIIRTPARQFYIYRLQPAS
jgi:hypothetical protein